jgi:hypothetical protein
LPPPSRTAGVLRSEARRETQVLRCQLVRSLWWLSEQLACAT